MNKLSPLLVFVVLSTKIFGHNFTATVYLKGAGNQEATFRYLNDSLFYTIQQLVFSNDTLRITGTIAEPTLGTVIIGKNKNEFDFFFDKGETQVIGEIDNPGALNVGKGSQYAYDYTDFENMDNMWREKRDLIFQAKMNAEMARDSVSLNKINVDFQKIVDESKQGEHNWIKEHRSSPVSAYQISMLYPAHILLEKGDSLLKLLDPSVQETKYTKYRKSIYEKQQALTVGKLFPDFMLNDERGYIVSLHSLKAKFIWVDFWASWCAPCRRLNKELIPIYQQFRNYGFEIISISADAKREEWLKAVEEEKTGWINVHDVKSTSRTLSNQLGITYLPTTFLLDSNLNIIAKGISAAELKTKLYELLK
jgi:thiol-disulfide isomerase/thioredoxin